MMQGERALFTMTPELAYGEEGAGWKIPRNATVRFDIELLGFDELDDMSGGFEGEEDNYIYTEEGLGREDVGPGGEGPSGRYSWERRGEEVLVTVPLREGLGPQDVAGEFWPRRVHLAVAGETVLSGTPGCELDWEACTWSVDADAQGRRSLLVHLQKRDAERGRWPSTLLLEETPP